ncbi:hypothetical protein OEA41_000732 [Lepraria neglecta]|uniref:NACHT domain-containing protein n=1 Tax=Lepraria neglecta TaxID=209136 RepID=A0AAD9ZGJ3_9LECA|nr:hypothetical protein OEA41_000732 [Lepraria neglecta]
MAEAITLVSLAASIAQLIGTTVKAYKYLNHVKNAPKERAKLSLEAANLLPLLNSLRDQVENASAEESWIESVLELGGPTGPLELFRRTMEQLKRKLKTESPMHRMGKHLVWTLDKEDIRKILADIERFKTRLVIALQKDSMKTSRAIKEDTSRIQPLNEEVCSIKIDTAGIHPLNEKVGAIITNTEAIGPLGETVHNISTNVDTLNPNDLALANESYLHRVSEWLSPLDFRKHHASASEARAEGTGRWFLDSSEYTRWREDTHETLFCPGIPGAGKTIIASLVIDDLRKECFPGDTATVYAYCYNKERSQQSMPNSLGGLLKQLLQARNSVPENVEARYEKHRGGYSRTTQIELSSLLRVELRRYRKAFIIIDALDQYSKSDNERDSLLAELQALKSVTNMMLTYRIVSPFVDAFQSAIRVPITANNHDVRRFLERQIPILPECVKSSLGLQELIAHTITELVEGMFLLARLHMQSFKDKFTARKVREALARLPKGSGSTASNIAYDDTIKRIREQEKGFSDLAIATLSWISLAVRPLSLSELQCALSIEQGDTVMDEDNFVDQETLSSVRPGLIIIDHESSVVPLAHSTTQQYFESRRELLFQDAQSWEGCLANGGQGPIYGQNRQRTASNRLLESHRKQSSNGLQQGTIDILAYFTGWDETVKRLTLNTLGRKRHIAASLCFQDWDRERKLLEEPFFPSGHSGISIAACYGLTDTVEAMLNLANPSKDQDESISHAISLAVLGE